MLEGTEGRASDNRAARREPWPAAGKGTVTGWKAEAATPGGWHLPLPTLLTARPILSRREITAATPCFPAPLPLLKPGASLDGPVTPKRHVYPPSSPALPVPPPWCPSLLGQIPPILQEPAPSPLLRTVPFAPKGNAGEGPSHQPHVPESGGEDAWLVSGGRGVERARGAV